MIVNWTVIHYRPAASLHQGETFNIILILIVRQSDVHNRQLTKNIYDFIYHSAALYIYTVISVPSI